MLGDGVEYPIRPLPPRPKGVDYLPYERPCMNHVGHLRSPNVAADEDGTSSPAPFHHVHYTPIACR